MTAPTCLTASGLLIFMKLKVSTNSIGQRLDKYLAENLPTPLSNGAGFSRSQIQKKIETGEITVNNKQTTKHYFLKEKDVISVNKKQLIVKNKKENILFKKIKIISKTSDYLVINKPTGLLVHPIENSSEKTLVDWLVKKYPTIKKVWDRSNKTGHLRPGIIHRLDRDVS